MSGDSWVIVFNSIQCCELLDEIFYITRYTENLDAVEALFNKMVVVIVLWLLWHVNYAWVCTCVGVLLRLCRTTWTILSTLLQVSDWLRLQFCLVDIITGEIVIIIAQWKVEVSLVQSFMVGTRRGGRRINDRNKDVHIVPLILPVVFFWHCCNICTYSRPQLSEHLRTEGCSDTWNVWIFEVSHYCTAKFQWISL